jgi:hypothetical protein
MPAKKNTPAPHPALAAAEERVRTLLDLETLETRKSDALDFRDTAVWQIREAVRIAFQAGLEAAAPASPAKRALDQLLHAAEMMIAARADDMLTEEEWDGLKAATDAGRKVLPPIPTEPGEMLATLKIDTTTRRSAGAGTWVEGSIAGHDFQALVFPEHAANASFELGRSRISKLWLREQATRRDVAAFERGWDVQPTTPAARTIVDLLCAGLAETVHGK